MKAVQNRTIVKACRNLAHVSQLWRNDRITDSEYHDYLQDLCAYAARRRVKLEAELGSLKNCEIAYEELTRYQRHLRANTPADQGSAAAIKEHGMREIQR